MNRKLGWGIALLSTLASSGLSTIAKITVDLGLDSAVVLALRLVIATALVALTILAIRPALLRLPGRGLAVAVFGGAVAGAGQLAYFNALHDLSASVAAMLFALYPLAVLLLLALRGEAFTRRNWLRLALGLLGVYGLLGGEGGQVGWLGVALVAFSVFGFALLTALIQWYLKDADGMTVTLYTLAGMGLVNVLGWAAQALPWAAQTSPWVDPGPLGWLAILLLAVLVSYIGRLTYFFAIRHIGGGQTALLMPLEILLSVLWSLIFLGERLTPAQWLGGGLIVLSTALAIERWPFSELSP